MPLRPLPCLLVPALLAAAPPEAMSPARRQLHLASFDQVWTTVQTRHWDPALGGLDWAKVRAELRPRVEKAATDDEARAAMSEMLGRLNQTHFGIVPAGVYADLEAGAKGSGTPGLDLRPLGGRAVVTAVDPGSPAERAGVKPGWELLRVEGRPVAPLIARLEASFRASTECELITSRRALSLLEGPVGETVDLAFDTGQGERTLKVGRATPRGELLSFGNMPASPFWLEHRRLPGSVPYLRFNLWMNPEAVAKAFGEALAAPEASKGFVLDLRGNPGGIGGMAMGAAGWFTASSGLKLGRMILRGSTLNFVVFPRQKPFTGPVAILVDGCSASTSEIFAGGMQDLKRARIFGTRSAGAALPSMFERLPNGDGFQYAIANYISDGGQPLEGRGVTPDEEVRPTRPELLAGRDPVLDRALEWIQRATR